MGILKRQNLMMDTEFSLVNQLSQFLLLENLHNFHQQVHTRQEAMQPQRSINIRNVAQLLHTQSHPYNLTD
ncbi:hypothetical protein PHET_06869 [Paragonimus heterotremus]|uniref:Uncharacterized protein n=1 Tax=Paragonimus heterotremus TaxID=100268 RepID=A0A8J4SJS0_9TREM|nr:hypothetical protein PHET_06869 [Paragonimus heterotremus]